MTAPGAESGPSFHPVEPNMQPHISLSRPRCALALAACLAAIAAPVFGQTPLETLITYQGYLTNSNNIIHGPTAYSMTFRLYSVATGGTALATVTQNVTVENSLFSADINI